MGNSRKLLTAMLAVFASLESLFGAGVTVITHGRGGDVDGWVLPMCRRIPLHPAFRGAGASIYRISITKPGTDYNVSYAFMEGIAPLNSDSGEIIIALDWSTISELFQPSTAEIAVPVANALLSTNLIPELGGRALAQLPLHLVGHSRGASMMAEVARLLGAQGVWVDHLTLLDPYPSTLFNSDPTLRNYANVFFAENYRQTYNFPTGVTLAGAYDRVLTGLTTGGYASGSEHSDVHLWYHGTVDFRTPVTVDGATISAAERVNWWTAAEQSGTNAGFIYSLVAKGNRFLTNNPGGSTGRISDGINKVWDFGAGLSPNRTSLAQNNGSWPNIVQLLLSGNVLSGPLQATVRYQHGLTAADTASLSLFLDADLNPWNTNHTELGAATLVGTGTASVNSSVLDLSPIPGLLPGAYNLFARATLGSFSRYYYAQDPVVVPPLLTNPRVDEAGFGFMLWGKAGWTVVIEETADFQGWTAVVTNVMAASSQEISISTGPDRRFFRAVLR